MSDPAANGDPRTVAQRLAEWASDIAYADIPEEVLATAKLLVLDQIGLQVRGSTLPHVQPERRLIEDQGCRQDATILNSSIRTSAAQAAYVNGTFGHSMEFDDCHLACWHAGSVIVPAAVAMAEQQSLGGRDVLLAMTVGHQVMATLGAICTPEMMRRGWHGPKAMGGFAAAAVTARLLDLSSEKLANAFAITASDASGTMEYDRSGGEVKRLHAGAAARSGVEAAIMASHGLTGPLTIFEGPRGIFQLFGATSDYSSLEQLWGTWHLPDTMFRLNPGVGTVLPALDIVADLKADHDFSWQEVTAVDVGLRPFAVEHGGHIVHPTDGLSAHFSLAFALALRIVTGASTPEHYVDSKLWNDPAIWKLSELVVPRPYEFEDNMPLLSAYVAIKLADGRTLSGTQGGFHGSSTRPATRDDVIAKYQDNVSGHLSDTDAAAVVDLVDRLEEMSDIHVLTRHLASRAS